MSGALRDSLLRDIQHKLDSELSFGFGGQRTRVTIGDLPPEPPRLRAIQLRHPHGRRSGDDKQQHQDDKSKKVTFSQLMSDFVEERPLPFRDPNNAARSLVSR